ncbi:MAG: helix-turn-helix transcriptional regulator [Lachnospiraceae bacterium]|nr:helix-turn-helix transcriptional regulator [Lachnospiraceae bacterium]
MEKAQMYTVDIIELKKIMVEKKLDKIIDLSLASKIDRNTLSKILNGDAKPSTTVIEKLMYTLQIPPEKAGTIFFNINLRNP